VAARRRPLTMDVRRLRSGELLAGVSAVGLVIALFAEWFEGENAWQTLKITLVATLAVALLALTLVVLTLTSRAVAMAVSAAAITVGAAAVASVLLLYRIVLDEPGDNAAVEIGPGAYLGLLFVLGCAAGAWRTLADERTGTSASRRQTERVLAVRGPPRPPPPGRDPGRGQGPRARPK